MRTTIRLDDALLAQAKEEALRSGRSLTRVIEDSLRESLGRRARSRMDREKVQLPTFGEGGLLPGVDLDSSAELLERMEDHAPL
jgi:predicted transcriptional regulator